jgi:acetylornithine deacetylase/succinyl-diaminopimelate desuccinylase-like protein
MASDLLASTRDRSSARQQLQARLVENRGRLIALCSELGRNDNQNPPGDTRGMVATCRKILDGVPGITVDTIVSEEPKVNLVARLIGAAPGRRLVMNGHLDTGPVVEPAQWTVPPFGGVIATDRIYGRGIADMKAGIAASVLAARTLAEFRDCLHGELALMLVADEGTGGRHGTQYVLQMRPELAGDAMISGDVGSPRVARIGEKGFVWIEILASGKSAAGAHPHLGANAVEYLLPALDAIRTLKNGTTHIPDTMRAAIHKASGISEALNGAGETHTLTHNTVNIGMIQGGIRINNVPSKAAAKIDIRMPPGSTVEAIKLEINKLLGDVPHIEWRVLDAAEPNWTAPEASIISDLARNAEAVLGEPIGISIRPGFSDGRFFRQRNVPTVVYGVTPQNGNAPDEHVLIDDLDTVFKVHALTAFDYLV